MLLETMPTDLGGIGHRLRHHGKHHERELWRTTSIYDIINTTTISTLERPSACYTNNEVLMIIGLTCVLNLAFIAVVVSCVQYCSSSTFYKTSSLHPLLLRDSDNSDTEGEEFPRKNNQQNPINISPLTR